MHSHDGVRTNVDDRILFDNFLDGGIPKELGTLSQLRKLYEFVFMFKLGRYLVKITRHLNTNAGLKGVIPEELFEASNLEFMYALSSALRIDFLYSSVY